MDVAGGFYADGYMADGYTASAVTNICNLALAKLGNPAKVTSVAPPDGSSEANYCALFYPQALNVLLSEHAWAFATKTVALAAASGSFVVSGSVMTCTMTGHGLQSGSAYNLGFSDVDYGDPAQGGLSYLVSVLDANTFTIAVAVGFAETGTVQLVHPFWGYAFLLPADFVNVDEVRGGGSGVAGYSAWGAALGLDDYQVEGGVLYSNSEAAVLGYMSNAATSPNYFPAVFVEALTVLLAAYLAGPLIMGDQGVAAGEKLMQLYGAALAKARELDGRGRKVQPRYVPAAIAARNGYAGCVGGALGAGVFPGGVNNVV